MPDIRRTYAGEAVRVEGLAELRGDLRRIAKDLPKVIRQTNVTAARMVRDEAEPNLVTKTGKRAPSRLTAGATQKYGYVQLSGPTAFGDEYGGSVHKQFRPFLGKRGYAVWPAVRKVRPQIELMILDWLEAEFAKRAA